MITSFFQVSIYNASVAHVMNGDSLFLYLNLVDYPIVSNSDAIESFSHWYLNCLWRKWFLFKIFDLFHYSWDEILWQTAKILIYRRLKANAKGFHLVLACVSSLQS